MGSQNLEPINLPENAVWFVTGTSSGIGSSFIKSILSNKDYRVVALSRNPASISLPATSNDTNTLLQRVDLRSEISIKCAFEAALKKFGRIDVVVNNAGYGLFGEFESTNTQDGRDLFEINYWAPVHITRQAIRIMRDVNPLNGPIGGTIAQVSSVGGYIAAAGSSFYHSTKWALEGFTESIDKELDPTWNIRFAIIEPGSVKTKWSGENMKGRDRVQHKAYRNKGLLTDKMKDMRNAFEDKIGADSDNVAELIVKVMKDVERKWGGKSMLRLPVGADAWALIKRDVEVVNDSLDKWKVESESTSTGDVKETLRNIGVLRD